MDKSDEVLELASFLKFRALNEQEYRTAKALRLLQEQIDELKKAALRGGNEK